MPEWATLVHPDRLGDFIGRRDPVPLKDRGGDVPRDRHRDLLVDALYHENADRGPPEVMHEELGDACPPAGRLPRSPEIPYLAAVTMEKERTF